MLTHASTLAASSDVVEDTVIGTEIVDVIKLLNETLLNSTKPHLHHHHQGYHGSGHKHFIHSASPDAPSPNFDSVSSSNPPTSDTLSPLPPSSTDSNPNYLPVPNGRGPWLNTGGYHHQSAPYHYFTMAASAVVSSILALSSLIPSLPQSSTNGEIPA